MIHPSSSLLLPHANKKREREEATWIFPGVESKVPLYLSLQDDEMVTADSPLCLSNTLPVVAAAAAAWYLERSVDFGHDALALSLLSFCRNSHNGTLCFATLQYIRPRHSGRRLCSFPLSCLVAAPAAVTRKDPPTPTHSTSQLCHSGGALSASVAVFSQRQLYLCREVFPHSDTALLL